MAMVATTVLEALSRAVVAMGSGAGGASGAEGKVGSRDKESANGPGGAGNNAAGRLLDSVGVGHASKDDDGNRAQKQAALTVAILKIFTKSLAEVVALMLEAGAMARAMMRAMVLLLTHRLTV